jgi:hypothetical protein
MTAPATMQSEKAMWGTSRLRGRGAAQMTRAGDDAERSDEEERRR